MRLVHKTSVIDSGHEFTMKIFRISSGKFIGIIFVGHVRVSGTDQYDDLLDCVIATRLLLNYVHDGNISP